MVEIYKRLAAFLPDSIVGAFKKQMDYLDIDISEKRFVGFLFIYGLILSFFLAYLVEIFNILSYFIAFPFFFLLFTGGTYLWLSIAAESKGKFVESILPDALQLVASNMKSGLTTERALLLSARPEFGPLENELRDASKRIMAGARIDEALNEIPKSIKSVILERTIWLVSKGISSGGQIANLLIQLSDDLRDQLALRREIAANISIYIMLIFFAAALGGPVLFGISSFIVEILTKQMATMPEINASNIPGGMGSNVSQFSGDKEPISVEFVQMFVMIMLVTTSLFASLTIGVINTGKEQGGLKYFPIILVVAFILFFGIRMLLASAFSNLV
ncbi:MAG: type II secretion system F family protein [Candidatus Diapherotrites archaeon]